jgi:hypothetical protein
MEGETFYFSLNNVFLLPLFQKDWYNTSNFNIKTKKKKTNVLKERRKKQFAMENHKQKKI